MDAADLKQGDVAIATEGELQGQNIEILREFTEADYHHYRFTLYEDGRPYFWCRTDADPTPRSFSFKCLKVPETVGSV
jgi:hypothetical protein